MSSMLNSMHLFEVLEISWYHKQILGFEDLQKAFVKASPVIAKEENGQTPRFFVRCLVEMEDFINETWEDREFRKNMSKNNR